MAIKDLEVRQGKVDIVVELVEIGDIREFSKFGRTGRVATATIKDESGEMKMSLWNEQIDQVKPGDKIHITDGYVNEFQGEKQLTTGKFGKLEVVGKAEGVEEKKEATPAASKEEEKKTGKEEKETEIEDTPVEEEKIE